MASKYLIYALTEPTGEIRYIGRSSSGLSRPRAHTQPYKLVISKTYTNNWVKSLLARGQKPGILVVQHVPARSDLVECEKYWISYFRKTGARLTNLSEGGEWGIEGLDFNGANNPFFNKKHSESTKEKMKQAKLGKPGNRTRYIVDNFGNIFRSSKAAGVFHKMNHSAVRNIVYGIAKQSRSGIQFKVLQERVG